MSRSRLAAIEHGHDYIGSEHVLLGLLEHCPDLFRQLAVDPERLRSTVLDGMPGHQTSVDPNAPLPFTPRVKAALRTAYAHAAEEKTPTLRPEFILAGLAENPGGLAGVALRESGVTAERVWLTFELHELDPEDRLPPDIWGRPPLIGILARARTLANWHSAIGTGHILLSILDDESGEGRDLLRRQGVSITRVRHAVEESLGPRQATAATGQLPLTAGARKALELAHAEATRRDADAITAPLLLLGLVAPPSGTAKDILTRDFGLDAERLRRALSDSNGDTSDGR
jgi:ATP-dependent Clp protease ATP-binding subunit ClpA